MKKSFNELLRMAVVEGGGGGLLGMWRRAGIIFDIRRFKYTHGGFFSGIEFGKKSLHPENVPVCHEYRVSWHTGVIYEGGVISQRLTTVSGNATIRSMCKCIGVKHTHVIFKAYPIPLHYVQYSHSVLSLVNGEELDWEWRWRVGWGGVLNSLQFVM